MKRIGIVSATLLFLLLGTGVSVYAQDQRDDPKPQAHRGERQRTGPRGAIVPRAADGGSDGASWRRLRLQLRRERLHGLNDPSGKEQAYNRGGATRLRERAPRPLSAAAFPRRPCGFRPA